MGQNCSCEEGVEGGPNTLISIAERDTQFKINSQAHPPWAFKSEQLLRTDFQNGGPYVLEDKDRLANQMSSSAHIRKSIFGDDDWRSGTPVQRQSTYIPRTTYNVDNKITSLRDIFDEKAPDENQTSKRLEYGKSIKSLKNEQVELEEVKQNQLMLEKKTNDGDYPVITATSLKKIVSLESKGKLSYPIESLFNENIAMSIDNRQSKENTVNKDVNIEMISQPISEFKVERMSKPKTDIFAVDTKLEDFTTTAMPISSRALSTPKNKNQVLLEGSPIENVQTITLKDGSIYQGELNHNLQNGKGKETTPQGDVYIGTFSMGIKSGFGKLNLSNGDKYRGNFENGKFHGMGTMFFTSGDSYIGEFKNGLINGIGTFSYSNGKVDKGFWRNSELVHRQ
jgi:hypothetical protein